MRAALLPLVLLAALACAAEQAGPLRECAGDGAVAVVCSDYSSTAVSLLRGDGTLCADRIIDSGSKGLALVTTLSGDVDLASTRHPDGWITLVDRTHSVLTFVDPGSYAVLGQLSVAGGFPANPHDVAYVSRGRAYVSRWQSNPTPTPSAGDLDDGGDVLVIDPSGPSVSGRIALDAEVRSPELRPNPDRFALAGGEVWAGLQHLSSSFDTGGEALLVALGADGGEIRASLALDGLKNPGQPHFVAVPRGLWVPATGVFGEGFAAQRETSGVAWIDLTGAAPAEGWRAMAADLCPEGPVGSQSQPLGGTRLAFLCLGDLDPERGDAVRVVDRASGEVTDLATLGPFESGGLLLSADGTLLLVADGDPVSPRIRRYRLDGEEMEAVVPCPSVGLPPRSLGRFR